MSIHNVSFHGEVRKILLHFFFSFSSSNNADILILSVFRQPHEPSPRRVSRGSKKEE